MKNVIVLGASDKTDRYSYKAIKLLQEHGHTAIPVNPQLKFIDGTAVYSSLIDAASAFSNIDTISVYVNPTISEGLEESILKSGAKRIIFNPGSENIELMEKLSKKNIQVEAACTLVLLRTGQF